MPKSERGSKHATLERPRIGVPASNRAPNPGLLRTPWTAARPRVDRIAPGERVGAASLRSSARCRRGPRRGRVRRRRRERGPVPYLAPRRGESGHRHRAVAAPLRRVRHYAGRRTHARHRGYHRGGHRTVGELGHPPGHRGRRQCRDGCHCLDAACPIHPLRQPGILRRRPGLLPPRLHRRRLGPARHHRCRHRPADLRPQWAQPRPGDRPLPEQQRDADPGAAVGQRFHRMERAGDHGLRSRLRPGHGVEHQSHRRSRRGLGRGGGERPARPISPGSRRSASPPPRARRSGRPPGPTSAWVRSCS